MPGFNIGDGGTKGADPKADPMREHRFVLAEFFGERIESSNPFFNLIDVDLPSKVINTIQIVTPSTTYEFPKSVNYTDLRITMYALPDLADKIKTLEDKIHTVDDGLKDFDNYMGKVAISLTDGKGEEVAYMTFENAFIADTSWGRLSYSSSEIKTVTITIKYSKYEISTTGG